MDIHRLLERGVAEIIVKDALVEKLASGRPLRLKLGFDPSKPDLHIGHAVVLRKLRQLQELGHQVILIVGDWTAQIGDPSGRDETRIMLTPQEVKANAQTYMDQFFMIVDKKRTEVRWQSEWYEKFGLAHVFSLASRFTLGQLMAHETFRKRYEEGLPLTVMELMYPLLQAYDSVVIKADVEFGGTDQKFNNLAGRELQRAMGQPPQDVFLVPLLPGTDGRKMGKTFDNTINFVDLPDQMYGKIMSITDEMLVTYFTLVTDVPEEEVVQMSRAMEKGTANPRDVKMRLAREIVKQFHGEKATKQAETEFVRVFQQGELPSQMPKHRLKGPTLLVDVMVEAGLVSSKSEARRLIRQGGVRLDGERVESVEHQIEPGKKSVLQAGRRKFLRIE